MPSLGISYSRDRALASKVLNVEAYGRNVESFLRGPGFLAGPKRYLPKGKPMELYWEYLGVMRARQEAPASWSTFWRVWVKIWGKKLRFRKIGQHASCDICEGLKREIKAAASLSARHVLLDRYLEHIFCQWSDRMVYWALCALSVRWTQEAMKLGSRLQWASVANDYADHRRS